MNRRLLGPLAALAVCLVSLVHPAGAHDVPERMNVHAFVKQTPGRVEMIVRVPLALLLSLDLPKRGPGYIDLAAVEPHLGRAAAAVSDAMPLYADDRPVALATAGTQLSRPANRAFEEFDAAAAHVRAPLPEVGTNIFWNQGYFDVAFTGALPSQDANLSLDPWIAYGISNRISLFLRYLTEEKSVAYTVEGESERIYLDPHWTRAAGTFTVMGVEHILGGIDHVLFVLAIILPFTLRDFATLAKIVTGFTVAHSITLSAAALGVVSPGDWFPPLVEAVIALSILYMCLENVFSAALGRGRFPMRWATTAGFGLVHGFGFAFVLQDKLQFSGDNLVLSLAAFNIGVELGQIAILAAALTLVTVVLREARLRRVGVIVVSALIGHTAWHWTVARFGELQSVRWPDISSAGLGVAVVTAAVVAGVWLAARHWPRARSDQAGPT